MFVLHLEENLNHFEFRCFKNAISEVKKAFVLSFLGRTDVFPKCFLCFSDKSLQHLESHTQSTQSWIECKKTPFTFHWSVDYFEECFSRASGNFDEPWSHQSFFWRRNAEKTWVPCTVLMLPVSFDQQVRCLWQGLFNSPNKSIHRSWNCVRLQLWRELPINVFLPCQLLDDIRSRWDSKLLWIKTQLFGFLAKQWCCVEWHNFFHFWSFSKVAAVSSKKAALLHKWVLVKKCKWFFTLFRKHKWFWKLFTQMIQESYLANFEPEADLLCKPSQF